MIVAAGWTGCEGTPGVQQQRPFDDQWRLEIDAEFPYIGPGNEPQITDIQIGGIPMGDNWANRGDVIVLFDSSESRIQVEMRRYTMASTEDEAESAFDRLSLIATNGALSADVDAEDDCSQVWQEGCEIRVFFDGQTQLQRSGADLKVTLPFFYRHRINVVTGDNLGDSDFHRRSRVCVEDLNASVDIELGSGQVFVTLDEDTIPMPQCEFDPDAVTDCEESEDGAWNPDCECIDTIGEFGRVRATSLDGSAANMVVQVPEGLWSAVSLNNEAANQMSGSDDNCDDESDPGVRCDACVDVPDYELDETIGDDDSRSPWENRGTLARPSDAALINSGFGLQLVSKACQEVSFTDAPDDFVGVGNGQDQDAEERGNLTVCEDCLEDLDCEDLLAR